ncbi:MAG: hypothetical protein Q8883_02680, partial [Sweet potato little leaf phytoplasma]|nr:hypothetical protein [Sweet potato little leaf phytoplasma]
DIIHIESPNFNKIIKYHLINYLGISEIVSNLFSQSPEARRYCLSPSPPNLPLPKPCYPFSLINPVSLSCLYSNIAL